MTNEKLIIYSDGGARGNPGPAAIGVVICDARGKILEQSGKVIGATTNNVAEYTAVLTGLRKAQELGAKQIDYYADSQLVVCQLNGEYRIKTPHIRELFLQVKDLERTFERVTFTHVPREHEKIRAADKMVNSALDKAGF